MDLGNAPESARHSESSGTNAGRQRVIAGHARIWPTWNFAALCRGDTPADVIGCPRGIGMTLAADVDLLLRDFSVPRDRYSHGSRTVRSPLTGEIIANVQDTSPDSVTEAIAQAKTAFLEW